MFRKKNQQIIRKLVLKSSHSSFGAVERTSTNIIDIRRVNLILKVD